ncbi:MAG: hypothetical protein WCL28_03585 [bacterium]
MIRKLFMIVLICAPAQSAFAERIRSKTVIHTQAYKPKPSRGPHIDIKVTPPGARGVDGRVLVEVYNRGKQHLALVQFDITLNNRGGFSITAPCKAEDLKPNMSGSQWVTISKIRGVFPVIDAAVVENLRTVTVEAQDVPMKGFVDLIKK